MAERVIDKSEGQLPLARRVEPEHNGLAPMVPVEVPISAILDRAVQQGMAPDALEKLVGLFNQQEDRKAAREFAAALAEFQRQVPPIRKTSTAEVVSRTKGTRFSYAYAELDEIARTIQPLLHKLGLSYSWDSAFTEGTIICTCIVRHSNGHSAAAKFGCPTDSDAGMTPAQKYAAALTYARRQSLIQALGLTTCDPDSDAARSPRPVDDGPKVTASQAADLDSLLDEVTGRNPDRRGAFLRYMGVEKLADLPASKLKQATTALENKRREQGGK